MRPSTLDPLFADATQLPGIGPKLAKTLADFTGDKIIDLLWHLPSNLIDRQYRPSLAEVEDGRIATFDVTIIKHEAPRRRNLPYRITCQNDSGFLSLVFFHAKGDWLARALPVGATRMISGRVERFRDNLQIVHPDHMLAAAEFEKLPTIEPVYPLTAGISAKVLMKAVQAALPRIPALDEWQQADWLAKNNWPTWQEALVAAHRPETREALEPHHPARQRLAYDELLAHQLVLALVRRQRRQMLGRQLAGREFAPAEKLQTAFLDNLPFQLTGSQIEAAADISADMQAPSRMLRLLQGDVGSGKTVVAVLAMLQAVANGAQAAIMAPTEILAQQHGETIGPWLDALGIRWGLITGRNKGKQRQAHLDALANGETQIAIGTHALFQDDIDFKDLGLAVVDEQHRFGVQQRMSLSSKGNGIDVLVMTATPIPRTLTLTAYGDMDVSRMPDKPPGRKPIDTRIFSTDRYPEVVSGLKNVLAEGARIYWVCPLVSESELVDLAAAEDRFKDLQKHYGDAVGLVHGQMKAADKDAVMARFQAGDIRILVATTVIEVGVNVPEATVMIIEHAERFGLAQLHQLRGRVGRGLDKSSCLLIYRGPLGETAKARLQIMRDTEDGFVIAEEDLRLRGAGEVLGTRQSGLPTFRIADLESHANLLPTVHDDVKLMLHNDPNLQSPRGQALRNLLYLFRRDEAIRYLTSG
jgi:ATP-dependent DNA helicase RecG